MSPRRLCLVLALFAINATYAQPAPDSIRPYEQQLAQPDPIARALNQRYAKHLASIRHDIAAQPRRTPPRLSWLDDHLAPLAKTELVDTSSTARAGSPTGCSLVIRCTGDDIQTGQPSTPSTLACHEK